MNIIFMDVFTKNNIQIDKIFDIKLEEIFSFGLKNYNLDFSSNKVKNPNLILLQQALEETFNVKFILYFSNRIIWMKFM